MQPGYLSASLCSVSAQKYMILCNGDTSKPGLWTLYLIVDRNFDDPYPFLLAVCPNVSEQGGPDILPRLDYLLLIILLAVVTFSLAKLVSDTYKE